MSWRFGLALICAGLAILCLAISLWPHRKPPVIKDKPVSDSRIYSMKDWK